MQTTSGGWPLIVAAAFGSVQAEEAIDRRVLPVREPEPATIRTLDARDAQSPPRFEVRAPKGAPNVVVVLLDDIGFGQSSAFGGPIRCPPSISIGRRRAALQQLPHDRRCAPVAHGAAHGRNHHANNAGAIMELATGFPGNTGIRPASVAPLAEMLRLNGYSTAAFGKYHETPPWEVPFRALRPLADASGFDKFYGFIGGETNQWAPAIFDGTVRVEHEQTPDYHFTVDMTDKTIGWMQAQHALTPDKPFFVYFATGALHAPHHVPKAYIDRYKGKFDRGWGRAPGRDLRAPEADGSHPRGRAADEAAQGDPLLGIADAGPEEARGSPDGDLRRLRRAHRRTGGPPRGRPRGHGRDRQHAVHLYRRRQRGEREGGPEGAYNEMMALNGIPNTRAINMPHLDDVGRPEHLSALRHRVGLGRRHAVPVDQADRVALRRHDERRRDPLAERVSQAKGESARSSRT
jgi:arylsulfatase